MTESGDGSATARVLTVAPKGSAAAAVPGSRHVVLEGAAHLANVEQPGPFTEALLEHLVPDGPSL